MLKINQVSKTFGDIKALDDVSFQVSDGEFVFLTGPSGAGKTTLLRLVLRELFPDEGEIVLEDVDITKLKRKDIPKLRQKIGVVFQDFKVLPERTVKENVEVALAVINLSRKDWKARIDHVLKLVGLEERGDLFPSQLSGGELQRVSLARALVVNPRIILADEPTGNLDWDTADKIMDLFEKISAEGKTILMATHHKLIINKLKKRIIELSEGKVVRDTGVKKLSPSQNTREASKESMTGSSVSEDKRKSKNFKSKESIKT
ncbi:cell division ATP-binding protein FtsE [Candidatus Woesebacteria bacterium RIFCSPLOWO2_01_FULL_39_61]|uniref:Cell division ATP-binding protein FtsE n=1 Tax=Candidatus Woesebacteria bacterium RIFCSPHIGHO2_02_FULL_39_13 TaxID=1802505 RepID=A0A1F7Z2N2_9BACT|nr:MAG: cell division ATP-binding protein FtsE [Candidatus Woesebacteria bacterium RIFCSPHIGHO2_01_FULL_39_95]OGM33797.1 MAG: cell division ATP-binding protein FtsE [Candidatus Woesebacteria bacterium RIFCSPHIGHO2_02_FULL_39_13]OGM38958.1 MAG: cell division ATP-binding protein FtsE [Candidatus Woesebacteria bacterium RIFCSPHIGHO2_12_FULL_40_20]OGM65606.1 MAG: cell division ATP-binding protein FtsE [Candidatus Woesebacteria bacterium RIFCSPLOWO2_01_FULL_39_61]OGM72540.1 MAG: cell division ATP-bi